MFAIPSPDAMLAEMSACAHRLGMAFGREAEAAADRAERLELFRLFDRCFFSVRVAIALQLRLKREGGGLRRTARWVEARAEALEAEAAEALYDPPECEDLDDADDLDDRPERYDERDRDREVERASLPILLKTLTGVAADAAALPGPRPAELPTLVDLLERVGRAAVPAGRPAPIGPRPIVPQPAAPVPSRDLRARLTGSVMGATLSPPAASASGPRLPRRPATGPPRR